MIEKLNISGIHISVDDDLHKYINKKIGKLDQYLPRHARESAKVHIKLKADKIKARKTATCEVIVRLPHESLTVKETTINMFAAIDIVEAKLKNQLKHYKSRHGRSRLHHKVMARFLRRSPA